MSQTSGRHGIPRWKRTVDLIGSVFALVILSPIIAATAVAVRLRLGSPVLFRQTRPGLDGVPFTLLKFRTMLNGDAPDEARLTTFGRRLRASSLDELPELVNVIRGEMSLVGPRPLLVEYLPMYSERQGRRHCVLPGLTGLAQSSGRNDLPWEDRLELDVQYVEQMSFWLDAKVVLMTIRQLVSRSGVSADGEATMAPFDGTREAGS